MKNAKQPFHLVIIGVLVALILSFVISPAPSNATNGIAFGAAAVNSNFSTKNPGWSKISLYAPDAEPLISINNSTVAEGNTGTTNAEFEISLSEAYTETVNVDFATEDGTAIETDDYIFTTGTVTFSIGITTQLIIIPVQGDYLDEGNETFTVSLSDPINGVLDDAAGLGTITDDDTAGLIVNPTSDLLTTELGLSDTFTMVLTSQPTAPVTVGLSSSDVGEGTVLPASLMFTDANWSTPQTVTVTGEDDDIDDGDQGYTIVTAAAVSADPNYNAMGATDVSVSNADDDEAGITVSPLSLMTAESGITETFTVVLTSQPTTSVFIILNVPDTGEGTIDQNLLTFTISNWSASQTVMVTGVDDDIDDGDITHPIQISASSGDLLYNAIDPDDVSVMNTDDDTAGILANPTSGLNTSEAGATDTFTVVLTSEPTTFVNINVGTLDDTEGIATPNPLEFSPSDWNVPKLVTVTGLNDDVVDGNIAYTIQITTTSADGNYHSLTPVDVSLTNEDDDIAGITVSPVSDLSTTEGGGSDSFTVVLTSEPTANVTIDLSSSDTSEGTISTGSLVFSSENWDTPQTVIVTGENDFVIDGDIAYTIDTTAAVSSDPHYDAMESDDVSVTNSDDDAAGFFVNPTSGLSTSEDGSSDTFTMELTSEPTAEVTIDLSSSNTDEGVVTPASLVFSATIWDTPQVVTITGVDDDVVDGEIAYTILTAAAVSNDGNFSGVNPPDITAANADDDVAGVSVNPSSGLITAEDGTSDTFTVVLDTKPVASVIVVLTSSDTTEGTVPPSPLTFTDSDWNIPQNVTVTGENDHWDDGDQLYNIQMLVSSGDDYYDGMVLNDVSVTNIDDDGAGISVNPISGLSTTEAGGSDSFTIVLTSQPSEVVYIDLSSSDLSEGSVAPASLTFNGANWNIPQEITVTGEDDVVQDGDIVYTILTDPATSVDLNYDQLDAENVSVTNTDDDSAGIIVSPTSGLITAEDGATDTFTVVLVSEPTHDVTIGLSSSRTDEGTVSPSSLTFTGLNWDTSQVVTVTGVNDDVDDNDQPYTIVTAAAISDDDNFSGLDAPNVSVTNTDDDMAGVTVNPSSGLITTENGGTDTFTVVLDSEPIAGVIIVPSSLNTTEGTVSPSSLTFTSSDWSVPQIVNVIGVDDPFDDGDQLYSIQMQTSSADANYDLMDLDTITVTNLDDDGAGFAVDPYSGLSTTEAGIADTFNVALTSQPTAVVSINLSSSDLSEGTVSPTSLFFNEANWSYTQTVTVTGVDDIVEDGDIVYSIITEAATSDDSNYASLDAVDVSVTNSDDDTAGIVVDPISGLNTTETSGTDTFSVVLISPPTAPLTIDLSSSDPSEGLVSPVSLSFTSANWNAAQVVTVTGLDDMVDDGDIAYSIIMVAASSDPNYDNFNLPDIAVTNLDDDHTPVAVPDAYITNQDIFTVTVPGVLSNDSDADVQDTLIAVLQTDVRNGSLTFSEDGSFVYTPGLTFNGEDDFTYKASDGTNSSPSVKVTITVDRVAPTVDWASPVGNGGQIEITNAVEDQIIQLVANPNDSKTGIERVYFYRWDAKNNRNVAIGNAYTDPYTFDFDTSVLNNGFNQINVEAYDIAGNKSDFAFIWLFRYSYLYIPLLRR